MKERAKEILEFIIEEKSVRLDEILERFNISKRTLYYDIKSINYFIKSYGKITNLRSEFSFEGDYSKLNSTINSKDNKFSNIELRKSYILYKILNGEKVSVDRLTDEMELSRNTIIQTMDSIKESLDKMHLKLVYKGKYMILGNEIKIREIYLLLMQEDFSLCTNINDAILEFDIRNSMNLTDYSLGNLSKFCRFLDARIKEGNGLISFKYREEVSQFNFYASVKPLLAEDASEEEIAYLSAYISTLSSLNTDVDKAIVIKYVDRLIERFEAKTAIILHSKDEFKKNIKRHLLSSYYRIKFEFPSSNPLLDKIKVKHESLFKIIKSIIENETDIPEFSRIRDEEIGFIVAYFGGYLRGAKNNGSRRNKVLVVCPNGLMLSKTLEIQLNKYIPELEIAGVMSLQELQESTVYYDYIISTVDIEDKENVIVVNPLITRIDIELLMSKFINFKQSDIDFKVELLVKAIGKHANILDNEGLKRDLLKIIYESEEKEDYQPMLNELVTAGRIQKVKSVKDWKEAIKVAAKPLLNDGSIRELYVEDMIENLLKHGPYIVLADKFALPHASSKSGVNKLSMSLLVVEDEVDLLGKPVNIFMVLAAIDNNSHIKALASLSEMLYDEENINRMIQGSESTILELINKQK